MNRFNFETVKLAVIVSVISSNFSVVYADSDKQPIVDSTGKKVIYKTEKNKSKKERAMKTLRTEPERIPGASVGTNPGGPSSAGAGD